MGYIRIAGLLLLMGGIARPQIFPPVYTPPITGPHLPATVFPVPSGSVDLIVAGPDGALWFTEYSVDKIGRITRAGAITEFSVGHGPHDIAAGPDGALWFTEYTANRIGRITPSGVFTDYALPTVNGGPGSIAVGSDGALWFTEISGNRIGLQQAQ